MTHLVELPHESFVPEIGKGLDLTVDMTKVPASVVWYYVTREIADDLRDSHASVTRESFSGDDAKWRAAKLAVAEKKLARIYAGEIRARGESTPADPIGTIATRLARVFIHAKVKDWQKGDAAALSVIAQYAAALSLPNTNDTERKAIVAAAIAKRAARDDVRLEAEQEIERLAKLKEKIAAPVADAAADL